MHPIYKTVKLHAGMDFSGAVGTPIYATGNGKVVYAEMHQGYGKCVLIDHGFNYQTLYAHLSAYNVKSGQKVKRAISSDIWVIQGCLPGLIFIMK